MWQTPKTNWLSTDKINIDDFNRIKNNMQYLIDLGQELYGSFDTVRLAADQTYTGIPYASMWNAIERDIDLVYENTFKFNGKEDTVTWYPNNRYIDHVNLNRIESTQLEMYQYLYGIKSGLRRLAFTLGSSPIGNRG